MCDDENQITSDINEFQYKWLAKINSKFNYIINRFIWFVVKVGSKSYLFSNKQFLKIAENNELKLCGSTVIGYTGFES